MLANKRSGLALMTQRLITILVLPMSIPAWIHAGIDIGDTEIIMSLCKKSGLILIACLYDSIASLSMPELSHRRYRDYNEPLHNQG